MDRARHSAIRTLRWMEKYTKTDMVYLVGGSFWLVLEQMTAMVLALTLAVAFGHFATQDTYGNFKFALSLASIISAFSLINVGTAVAQSAARGDEGTLRQGFSLYIRWSALMISIGLVTSGYYLYQGNAFLASSLLLITAISPFLNGFSLYRSFLIGKQDFRRTSLYTIAGNVLPTFAVMIALFVLDERAIYLVATYYIANILVNAFLYVRTIRLANNATQDPNLFQYGMHLSTMNVISTIADKIDSLFVFSFLGPMQLAVYSYAIAIPEQIKGVMKNVDTLSMPAFARRSLPEIQRTIWKRLFIFGLVTILVIIAYALTAPYIFSLLFPVYVSSVPLSQLYAISLIFSVVVPITSIFRAHRKTTELYIVSNIGPIALIILLPIFTILWGIEGAILSQIVYRLITSSAVLILFLRMVRND